MRDEQVTIFAEAGREAAQYEPTSGPDVPDYAPAPSAPPSGDIDCSTYVGLPIVVPSGSDCDGDNDGLARE